VQSKRRKHFSILIISEKQHDMKKDISEARPGPRARLAGVVYLFYFLTAILGQLLHGRGPALFSDALNIISFVCYIAVTLLFYYLFKPVNMLLSLVAALFSLAGCAIGIFGLFNLSLWNMSPIIFFAPYCLLIGWLILRSTFLPRMLGVLMLLAGLGWLAYLSPLVKYLSLYIMIVGILAEASLMLWLVVKGVNAQRWEEQRRG
jgi:Domain of unknown function (DUF4386)